MQQLAAGKAVQVLTLDREITTQQAADLLNVSRPYLVKKVGQRRRLYLEDVLAYQAGRAAAGGLAGPCR
ncbi:hypothetical protein [Deinococcus sonorensis]|uniref:Helix-turn-helix domain-containing protein n=2 Tax=Deinococcus sonorensis TaxID=309891 RepID=A0AAU7U795_9DEIO